METSTLRFLRAFASPIIFLLLLTIVTGVPRHAFAAAWVEKVNSEGTYPWAHVASSETGEDMVATKEDGLYVSTDYGDTWNLMLGQSAAHQNGGGTGWSALAVSADGQDIYASQAGGYIWASTDGGLGWHVADGDARDWAALAMSADGMHIAASADSGVENSGSFITHSDNGGTSWTTGGYMTEFKGWDALAYSPDGSMLVAGNYIATTKFAYSADHGASWQEGVGPAASGIYSLAATDSGEVLAGGYGTIYGIADLPGYIADSEENDGWTSLSATADSEWSSIALASEGELIVATRASGYIVESANGGTSWNDDDMLGSGAWKSVAMSDDGAHLVVAGTPGLWVFDVNAETTPPFAFTGGTGSTEDPYQVDSCDALQAMSDDLSASYIQTADIDCTSSQTMNPVDGEDGDSGYFGFAPIGDSSAGADTAFTGSFDGNGFAISHLYINRHDDNDGVGLFGATSGATITGVTLEHAHVLGHQQVGGVIGQMDGGTLSDSMVNLTTTAGEGCVADDNSPQDCVWARLGLYGGGLVGVLVDGDVTASKVAGPVRGSGSYIGGLIGHMEDGTLSESSTSSDTDGGTEIGGAIGQMEGGDVTHVFATGNQDANQDEGGKQGTDAGGFVGYMSGGTISESYATGHAGATVQSAGGFVGQMESGSITDAYATGGASSDVTDAGGFIGIMDGGTITSAYASGPVAADSSTAGGFVGLMNQNSGASSIINSFATGEVTTGDIEAGFAGLYNGTDNTAFTHDYFDSVGTGSGDCYTDSDSAPSGVVASCAAVSGPSQFKTVSTGAPLDQWDFDAVWETHANAFPTLKALPVEGEGGGDEGDGDDDSSEHHSSGGHGSSGSSVPGANTSTTGSTLQSQIAALMAQVAALQSQLPAGAQGSAVVTTGVRDLTVGDQGPDVTALQKLLIAQGYAIPAGATGFFVNQTRDALAKYQSEHGIVPPVGYFGIITRTEMKSRNLSGLWW